jgi:predicted O-methyltransferase YrrM
MKTYKNRNHLLQILAEMKIKTACEVGVKAGEYASKMLQGIPSLEKLYLIDLWEIRKNHIDASNPNNKIDFYDEKLKETKEATKKWREKVEILKGHSGEMCNHIKNGSLDWAYIDAGHDYLSCIEDLRAYWPKIKSGGIMSGHDYHTAAEVKKINKQDWSICYDGSINEGAVKGAVDDFARENNLQILLSYQEMKWHTWSIVKE